MSSKMDSEFLAMIKKLSASEKQNLVDQILNMMSDSDNHIVDEHKNEFDKFINASNDCPVCPHCGAAPMDGNVIRKGHTQNGSQRFYCKSCGRFFVPTAGTVFAYTHKPLDMWRKFIELTITGATLHTCQEECQIAYQTAFTWRHKVLNAFKMAQENITMTGWVEADEMLVPISYKGNHIRGKVGEKRVKKDGVDTRMPRKALKRGSDNKSNSSKNKACVFCMVENSNQAFYGAVPCTGFMNVDALNATVGKRVDPSSATMLVDQYRITRNYLNDNNYANIVLAANTTDNRDNHKAEIQGENRDIHLQHVNAMHAHLRKFLKDYYGVSSKYLANYVALYTWLKNNDAFSQRNKSIDASEQRVAQADCYVSRHQLEALPAVPSCVSVA